MLHFSLYQEQAVNRWEFPADQFVTYKFVYLFAVIFIKYWLFFYLFMNRTKTKKIVQAIGQVQFVVFKKISSAYLN